MPEVRVPKRLRAQTPAHARSVQQERETAERLGGRTTPGSGSKYQKGDVRRRGLFRIECKCTRNASFSVTRTMVRKLDEATLGTKEIPVFQVELLGNDRIGQSDMKFYVVRAQDMEEMLERLGDGAS